MAALTHWSDRVGGAAARLVVSIVLVGVTIALMPHDWSWTLRGLAGWSVGAGAYLFMAWRIMLRADPAATKHRCRMDDASRGIVDLLLTVATFASIGAVCLALKESSGSGGPLKAFSVGVPILGVVLAWLLVHTLYALHYARLFYHSDDKDGPPAGGFDFHEDEDDSGKPAPPDYRDFLYLAFSIACTYGVTDVVLTCKSVRRTVWKHGLLSFVFATIVLALAVNVITNLLSSGG